MDQINAARSERQGEGKSSGSKVIHSNDGEAVKAPAFESADSFLKAPNDEELGSVSGYSPVKGSDSVPAVDYPKGMAEQPAPASVKLGS